MKRNIRWVLTITLLIIVVVLVYYRSMNKETGSTKEEKEVIDKDVLLSKDLEEEYPLTVCQVLNLFTRIQKCYYNVEYSNEEFNALASMAREVFDEELLENNPMEVYMADLKQEVNAFKKQNKIISRIIVGKSSEVTYSTVEGVKYASVECIYYVQDDEGTSKNITTYILRKDEDDKWKILGWQEYQPSAWEE